MISIQVLIFFVFTLAKIFFLQDTLWWECLDQELFRWPHELKGLENQRCEDCEAVPGYAGDVSAPKLPDDVLAVMALNAAWFHYSFWTRHFFLRDDELFEKHPGVFAKSQVESKGNKSPIEFQFLHLLKSTVVGKNILSLPPTYNFKMQFPGSFKAFYFSATDVSY